MNTIENLNTILKTGKTTTAEALNLFDHLETVPLAFMFGKWQGSGLQTNHPMDGLLELFQWYGKEFVDPEQVHPLLFLNQAQKVIAIKPNPTLINLAVRWNFPKAKILNQVFQITLPLLITKTYNARLRMMEYRQKVSATMIYDDLPIQDHFRRVDDNTVLGVMDFKAVPQPFFFVLKKAVE